MNNALRVVEDSHHPELPDAEIRAGVERRFIVPGFAREIGIELAGYGTGWCESVLTIEARHLQHSGVVHAGVQTTIADHTAGAAASTLLRSGQYVVSVEFKLNLLRPGRGESLWCRAEVLKPGRQFSIVESAVYACGSEGRELISKMTVTMAVLQRPR